MTDEEWLACTEPQLMLEFLRGKASNRKFRLFATACCRRIWSCLRDDRSRIAIVVSERYADGQVGDEELLEAHDGASAAAEVVENSFRRGGGDTTTVNATVAVSRGTAIGEAAKKANIDDWWVFLRGDDAVPSAIAAARFAAFARAGGEPALWSFKQKAECTTQAALIRCIFSDSYHPVSAASAWTHWNDGIIPKLAKAIYEDRAFDHLPILADALEEAGCTDTDILNHCRHAGEHVRGCWVIDLLLGKS